MVCESCRFCSGVRPISAFKSSRSMPGRTPFPRRSGSTPCASELRHFIKGAQQSSINSKLMALRFSGRFRVSVATCPQMRVECLVCHTIAANCAWLLFRSVNPCEPVAINRLRATPSIEPPVRQLPSEEYRVASGLATPRCVAGERQPEFRSQCYRPARPAQRGIRPVRPEPNQSDGSLRRRRPGFSAGPIQGGCADEPQSQDSRSFGHRTDQFRDLFRAGHSDCISERNHLEVFDFEQFDRLSTSSTLHSSPYGLPNAMEI